MRKYKVYVGMIFIVCICSLIIGCEGVDQDPGRLLLSDKTKCMFCGDGENSFRSIFSDRPGVGLFCLSDQRMIEIQPSAGEEIKEDLTSHVWADAYSVQIDRMIDRGISLVQYMDEGGILDLDRLYAILCSECMVNIRGSVQIFGKGKKHKEKAVCLVDFSTMELYGIQQSFQYYMLDDYYVQASCQDDKIRLTVFQTSKDLGGL